MKKFIVVIAISSGLFIASCGNQEGSKEPGTNPPPKTVLPMPCRVAGYTILQPARVVRRLLRRGIVKPAITITKK